MRFDDAYESLGPTERDVDTCTLSRLDGINQVLVGRAYPDMVDDDAPDTFSKHGKARAFHVSGQVDSNEGHSAKVVLDLSISFKKQTRNHHGSRE